MSDNINTEFPDTEREKTLKTVSKKKRIIIALILVCTAAFIIYLFFPDVHYRRFTEAEIGDSFSQVHKKTGGKYENGILTVSVKGKKIYFYRFENDILTEKRHHYWGSGFGSDVNYENFSQANAAMTLNELKEIFGEPRLLHQNGSRFTYLWMKSPEEYIIFEGYPDAPRILTASKMLNPVKNDTPITMDVINSLGLPSSVEELENRLGAAVTIFRQRYFRNGTYEYSCYVCVGDTEYVISFEPENSLLVIASSYENIIDPQLASELDKKMTYSDVVSLFGAEGFWAVNSPGYTEYVWGTSDSDTRIAVRFDPSGHISEYFKGSILSDLLNFCPAYTSQWRIPEYH